MEKPFLNLQPSEVAVLDAASRILAAYIASKDTSGAEDEYLDRALHLAIKLAMRTEETVACKGEVGLGRPL